jgi:curved DNA-binding protein CbpA
MIMTNDYYEILEVAADAEVEVIKQNYRRLVRENHPDVAVDKETAHERMRLILTAWNVLSDPSLRARYDLTRRENIAKTQPSTPRASSTTVPAPSGPSPFYSNRPAPAADPIEDARKRQRVQQVMRGGATPPRSSNARTRLLTMVFEAAQLYHGEGRADEAIRVCNQVIKADPTNAEAVALLGDIYAEQDRKDVALVMYERAMRLQPNNLLYRQKWDKLRHGDTSTSSRVEPVESNARAGINPWAKTPKRKTLADRLAETADKATSPTASQTASTAAEAAEDVAPPANETVIPEETPLSPSKSTDEVEAPDRAKSEETGSSFLKIKLPWRR